MNAASPHPDYCVVKHALSQQQCRFLEQRALNGVNPSNVGLVNYSDGRGDVPDLTRRVVHTPEGVLTPYFERLVDLRVRHTAQSVFGLDVWADLFFQTLVYAENGKYVDHSDALKQTYQGWTRINNRVISAVIYLSDYGRDFDGGEFVFSQLGITVEPQRGDMLVFRSDLESMLHRVNPVTRGRRAALVNWFRLQQKE